jgi:hypothetical protein
MSVTTLEGIVEDGQIRLLGNVELPERARVYVVIPGLEVQPVGRIVSPRLARPEQVVDFMLEVIPEDSDDGL